MLSPSCFSPRKVMQCCHATAGSERTLQSLSLLQPPEQFLSRFSRKLRTDNRVFIHILINSIYKIKKIRPDFRFIGLLKN